MKLTDPEKQKLTEAEQVGYWSEEEVLLTQRRTETYADHGLDVFEADRTACRLVQRDRDLDDRRMCVECVHLVRGRCRERLEPVGEGGVSVLHRCPTFKDYGGI